MVIGLAISHPSNITAGFHARHVLQACKIYHFESQFPSTNLYMMVLGGSYLKDPKEQREALAFLEKFEIESTWKASHIAENLRIAWSRNG